MEIRGISGLHQGRSIPVNGSVVIGRNPQSCTVVYPDNTKGISRLHCRVDAGSQGGTITDLGSSYGTFLNGRKIPPNVPTPLHDGDTFYIGDQSNLFSVSGAGQGSVSASSPSRSRSSGPSKGLIAGIIAAAALVLVLAVVLIINISGQKNYDIKGTTWKIAGWPGARMSFAENGDLIVTKQGEFEINGSFTYSPAGDNMVTVKYTSPVETSTVSKGASLELFSILGGNVADESSVSNLYSSGYVWKYKYNKKTNSLTVTDVNDYALFTLEQ